MGQVNFDVKQEGNTTLVSVSGTVDEDSANSFPTSDSFSSSEALKVNLEKLESINSCGIREWVIWVKSFPESLNVHYIRCPRIFVEQINMIDGLVPESGKVDSFYVPYYCDDSDHITNKLVERGKDYNGDQIDLEEYIKCEKSGSDAEIDVIESKYLKFLKKFG